MFTIKYRYYQRASEQPVDGPTFFDECESVHGPFDVVSQYRENGYIAVTGIYNDGAPQMTWGPEKGGEAGVAQDKTPRSIIWVMNEGGATVAKYDL